MYQNNENTIREQMLLIRITKVSGCVFFCMVGIWCEGLVRACKEDFRVKAVRVFLNPYAVQLFSSPSLPRFSD